MSRDGDVFDFLLVCVCVTVRVCVCVRHRVFSLDDSEVELDDKLSSVHASTLCIPM